MPRENSFSDEDGRSLTPDLEEEVPRSPSSERAPLPSLVRRSIDRARKSNGRPSLEPIDATFTPSRNPVSPHSPASRRQVQATSVPLSTAGPTPARPSFLTPTEKFRSAVRKIMALHRSSSMMMRRGVGAEPGVDPRRASAFLNYGHIKQNCTIEIVDYAVSRSSSGRMTNAKFVEYLSDPAASTRESWVKVRWINVGGISWDVVSALALKYDLHPLALEDVLHQRQNARSKADYYPKHLFLRLLRHSLAGDDDTSSGGSTPDSSMTDLPRSSSPVDMDSEEWDSEKPGMDDERTVYGSGSKFSTRRGTVKRRFGTFPRDLENQPPNGKFPMLPPPGSKNTSQRKDSRNMKLIRELKKGEHINVKLSPMYIFLFRDGTVISINKDTKLDYTAPIMERLRHSDTGLRTTADPSLLVQSLLDLLVDQALEVIEGYQSKILKLEQAVLLKPSMKTVRRLHIVQGDLMLHRRTLEPIKTVIYGLRRYDVDRVAALQERQDPNVKVEGYMSHKSKIYLADVHDHMEYILSSLDMFAGISENLINYTFNMSSYQMNEVMRRLTLATIIFLPLTLLTGYFGMNFNFMWSIQHGHSDAVFWAIALPLMAIVIPVFLWSDFERMGHYLKKRMAQNKVKKTYKVA